MWRRDLCARQTHANWAAKFRAQYPIRIVIISLLLLLSNSKKKQNIANPMDY